MKKYRYPAAPVVLGVVLGRLMELNFSQALMVGGAASFYTRPLTVILFAVSVAAVVIRLFPRSGLQRRTDSGYESVMATGIRPHREAIFMAGCVTVQGLSELLRKRGTVQVGLRVYRADRTKA